MATIGLNNAFWCTDAYASAALAVAPADDRNEPVPHGDGLLAALKLQLLLLKSVRWLLHSSLKKLLRTATIPHSNPNHPEKSACVTSFSCTRHCSRQVRTNDSTGHTCFLKTHVRINTRNHSQYHIQSPNNVQTA